MSRKTVGTNIKDNYTSLAFVVNEKLRKRACRERLAMRGKESCDDNKRGAPRAGSWNKTAKDLVWN